MKVDQHAAMCAGSKFSDLTALMTLLRSHSDADRHTLATTLDIYSSSLYIMTRTGPASRLIWTVFGVDAWREPGTGRAHHGREMVIAEIQL